MTTVLTQSKRLVDAAELDQYFPNGKANEYTQDHNFVNISFINPVSLKNSPVWDLVPKDHSKHNKSSYTSMFAKVSDSFTHVFSDTTT